MLSVCASRMLHVYALSVENFKMEVCSHNVSSRELGLKSTLQLDHIIFDLM